MFFPGIAGGQEAAALPPAEHTEDSLLKAGHLE